MRSAAEQAMDPRAECARPWRVRAGRCVAVLAVVMQLVACAGLPGASSAGQVPRPTLAQERQRLAALFEGTPVVLASDRDGSLRAEVPLRYCFDPARAVVKPPLVALLERLAHSPATRGGMWSVAAPGDPGSKGTALAGERAASVRDYLVGHGADAARVAALDLRGSSPSAPVVRVVVSVPDSAAVAR